MSWWWLPKARKEAMDEAAEGRYLSSRLRRRS